MPIAIGVSLEKDGPRGVFGGISGDGKGFREIREVEDGTRQEELLQVFKRLLTSGGLIPVIAFLRKV